MSKNPRPAAITAFAVVVVMGLQQFLGGISGWLWTALVSGGTDSGLYDLNTFHLQPDLDQLLWFILPFFLGTFLALWLCGPISSELSIARVLVRAVLATAMAAAMCILFSVVRALIESMDASPIQGFIFGASSGVSSFIFKLPLVALATVLLWLWLREQTPRGGLTESPAVE